MRTTLFALTLFVLTKDVGAQSHTIVAYPDHMAGRRTSNGSVYNPNGLTAAHPSLPFGTMLEIASSSTGQNVTVEVTDRGLFLGDGQLIVSAAAMRRLGLDPESEGTVMVKRWQRESTSGSASRVTSNGTTASATAAPAVASTSSSLSPPRSANTQQQAPPKPATTASTPKPTSSSKASGSVLFAVQLGSYTDKSTALELAGSLDGAWIQSATVDGSEVHRVFFGHFGKRADADGWRARLSNLGMNGYVRSLSN